jgi:hydroxyacylglutathione hydrolase
MIEWQQDKAGNPDLCVMVAGRQHLPNYIYILAHPGGDALVIDPGYAARVIRAELARHRLVLRGVLLTHGHSDHLAAVSDLAPPVTVIMTGEQIDPGHPLPNLTRCIHDRPFALGTFRVLPLATPGHSPGSACYLIGGRLFTGDTVFMESIGDCAGPGGDVDQISSSIALLKDRIADDIQIYPGHCFRAAPGGSFGRVRRENIYFRLNERDAFANWHRRFAGATAKGKADNAPA